MSGNTAGPLSLIGPAKPTPDAPEGGDYGVEKDGQLIAEFFARSSYAHTWPGRENAEMYLDAPAMRLALDLIAAGVAELRDSIGEMRFIFDDELSRENLALSDTWTATINAIGWQRCVEALAAARGGV